MTSGEDLFIAICGFAIVVLFAGTLYFMGKKDKEKFKPVTADENFGSDTAPNTRTGVSGGSETITLNFDYPSEVPNESGDIFTKEAVEDALQGKIVNFSMGCEASVTKKKKGKKTVWGCSLCPSKEYKHAPSAYNHIKSKH